MIHESWITERDVAEKALKDPRLIGIGVTVSNVAAERGVVSTVESMEEMLALASADASYVKSIVDGFTGSQLRALAAMACVGFMTATQTALFGSENDTME